MNAKRMMWVRFLAIMVCLALAGTLVAYGTATVSTDKKRYAVGETMKISGSGFTPQVLVTVSILRPDKVTDVIPGVTSDTAGNFTASYTPAPSVPGRFFITATDGANSANTATTEADAIKEDFLQCGNKNPTLGVCDWISSILQTSDAKIFEGMSTLQRLTFDQIPATGNNVHVLKFHIDATKAASHAYDFITTWDAALAATNALDAIDPPNTIYPVIGSNTGADPACDNPSNPQASLRAVCRALRVGTPTLVLMSNSFTNADVGGAVSVQTAFTNYQSHFSSGNTSAVATMWGSAAITNATLSFDGYNNPTGDQQANYTLTWTSTSDQAEIEFGAHVAQGIDTLGFGIGYGQGLGAANIKGGPYHVSIDSFDGASLGSQDNQLKGSDIILPPGNPTVTSTLTGAVLDAAVEVGTSVHDTANIDTGSALSLIPAGSTVSFQLFSGLTCGVGSGSLISTQSGVSVPSGGETAHVDSNSFTPAAGQYSYLVTFTSGNTSVLKSGVGDCEPFTVVDLKIVVSPLTATNEVGANHVITATVSQNPGTGFVAAPDGSLVTFSITNSNGATATFVGGNTCTTTSGSCSVTINSPTAGHVVIQATTTVSVLSVSMTRTTGDGKSGDSASAQKDYVDARIALTPLTATNEAGVDHVITATVSQNTGSGFVAAPNGTVVTFSLTNTLGATAAFTTGPPFTCTISNGLGTCTITINSPTAGHVVIHATTTFTVLGQSLTRSTSDGKSGDGVDAQKDYISASTSLTFVSQNPAGANLAAGTSVTITINEANTGTSALHAVSVTGGGKCTSWTPAGGATTIAVGASLNFTCTFTVAAGANAWSGDGQGLDSLNNAVPATGEHVDGSINGVSASTSLTFVSQNPAGANLEAGTSVTITINEANTGNSALHAVSVTGGGKCSSWTPAGGATTIAVGASLNFTCTFTVAAGANAWSGDGQGLDSLNNAVPATGEHVDGSLNGVSASTSLTFVSQNPAGASLVTGTSVTITINEANTGNSALHAVSVTGGGKCSSWTPAGGATTIAVGASLNFTCTFSVSAGVNANAWSGDGQGLDSLNVAVPAAGEHVNGNLTGLVLPTLLVTKTVQGQSDTFSFTTNTLLGNFSLTPAANGSASSNGGLPFTINIGSGTVNEASPPATWLLDPSTTCTGASGGFTPSATGGTFIANYGDTVVCNFLNVQQLGGATRTQGFWATHTDLTNSIWNGPTPLPLPNTSFSFLPVIGTVDAKLCTALDITAIVGTGQNQVMGGFWSAISSTSTAKGKNGQRSDLDQARMQFLQQYLAAVLNVHAFGTTIQGTTLAHAREVYCTGTAADIRTQMGLLAAYNSSGDPVASGLVGYRGTPQESKLEANIPFWDTTTH